MLTDPVADMLTRIRNANKALHDRTEMPTSKLKEQIAKLLKDRGHIQKTREKGREIVDSMLAMIKKLPCKAEATELGFFVEVMAKREF